MSRHSPRFVARRAGKGFKAGYVFPQDKQTIRGYGVCFGDGEAWTRPWHEIVGDWVEVKMVDPDEFEAATGDV